MQTHCFRLVCEFDRFVFVVVVVGCLADDVQAVQLMDYCDIGDIATAKFFRQTHVICCTTREENLFKCGAARID